MTHPLPTLPSSAGRRALRRAVWQAGGALAVTAGLVAAVDAGARILGPAIILLGSYAGGKALRDWWRLLDQERFLAEVALVSIGWALLAAGFAAVQYVAFSVAPGAFYVDPDYAKVVAPRYRVAWARDSTRLAGTLADVDRAARLLRAGGPPTLVLDSLYALGNGATGQLNERCEEQLPLERCPWQVVVVTDSGATPVEVPIATPEDGGQTLSLAELQRRLDEEQSRRRKELVEYARRMSDPAAFVQPSLVDFLYDTGVAFSGNDAHFFAPISPFARFCKIIEFLASLLLFGMVVARVSSAASARRSRR